MLSFVLVHTVMISTHAPHAGSDSVPVIPSLSVILISTHAPHAGSDGDSYN